MTSGTWAFYPDPSEHERLLAEEADQLAAALIMSGSDAWLIIAAVYDLLHHEQEEKASAIFDAGIQEYGAPEMSLKATQAVFTRVFQDGQNYADQQVFITFCQEKGLKPNWPPRPEDGLEGTEDLVIVRIF